MPLFASVLTPDELRLTATVSAFRRIRVLAIALIAISAATAVVTYLVAGDPAWTTEADASPLRAHIMFFAGLVLLFFAVGASRGSWKGYLYVRIESIALLASVVVVLAIPGLLPVWMMIEQAVCGLLLLGIVVTANGRALRSLFAGRRTANASVKGT